MGHGRMGGRGMGGRGQGQGTVDRDASRLQHLSRLRAAVAESSREALTAEEREDLLLMREEEKLARDVYLRLFGHWGMRPFANISGAEQMHMDAILLLLEHYALPDPAEGLGAGRFRRPDLQDLYDQLVQQGLQSPADAVRVGLLIEELDISDLKQAERRTGKPWIRAVYAELERGSRNHLRAFYRWKQTLGTGYTPRHLSSGEFERIALSAHEACC